MTRRLVVELDTCRGCRVCTAECGYPYHPDNPGVSRLLETAAYELTCRQCEAHVCVEACPNDALEEQEDGLLWRYNMRCTGCLSCSLACPFGNIIPAALQFQDAACDFCAGLDGQTPDCVRSCPEDALSVEEVSGEEENVHLVGDNLAVRGKVWQKTEVPEAQ